MSGVSYGDIEYGMINAKRFGWGLPGCKYRVCEQVHLYGCVAKRFTQCLLIPVVSQIVD